MAVRSDYLRLVLRVLEEPNFEARKDVWDKAHLSLSILHVKLQAVRRQSDPKIPLSNASHSPPAKHATFVQPISQSSEQVLHHWVEQPVVVAPA